MRTPKTIANDAQKLLAESRLTSHFLPASAKRGLELQVEFMLSVAYLLAEAGIDPDTDTPVAVIDPAPGA